MPRRRLSFVHVTTFYPPHNFGGDGVHVQRLAHALARRGHDVTVVHTPAAFTLLGGRQPADRRVGDGDNDDSGVAVRRLGGGTLETVLMQQLGRPVLSRGTLRRLLEGAPGRRPDVIHFHNVSLAGGPRVLGFGDAVKLYTTHDYWLMCPTHLLFRYGREVCHRRTCVRCTLRSGRPPQAWRRLTRLRRYLHELDAIIFPSRLTRDVYRAHGIDRPGRVLPHFLPDDCLAAAMAAGARRPDVAPYFLYVGRLDAVKGIDSLIRHVAARPDLPPLHVAGDGPLAASLRAAFGRHPSIRFLGTRPPADLAALYRDALALVLPSAGYEIFGQVVLEAFAHGTPAVVTRVGGARELVDASGAGFTYDTPESLDTALRTIASTTESREALGQRARAYAEAEHREAAYLDRYEALVEELGA